MSSDFELLCRLYPQHLQVQLKTQLYSQLFAQRLAKLPAHYR